jgi:hypothetical protein
MVDTTFTLRNVFSIPLAGNPDQKPETWRKIEQDIASRIPNVNWVVAMPEVAPKIDELFNIEIPNIFVAAWNKSHEIQAAINETKNAPEEIIYVELAEHSMASEHYPYVEMSIRNSPAVKIIELTVKLAMKLKGFQLKIQHGAIREIRTGACEAEGTIEYRGLVIAKKKLGNIVLPGSIPLHSGGAPVPVLKP